MTTVTIKSMFASCKEGVTGAKVNFKALAPDGTILAIAQKHGKIGGGYYESEPYSFRLCDYEASNVIAECPKDCSLDFTWRNEPQSSQLTFPP